jgi:hypothetical protein
MLLIPTVEEKDSYGERAYISIPLLKDRLCLSLRYRHRDG